MKKVLLFCLVCLGISTASTAGVSSDNVNRYPWSNIAEAEKDYDWSTGISTTDDGQRTFHVLRCANAPHKLFLMIGKKADTMVTIKIFNKNGSLLYRERRIANEDFSTILNLENIDGAVVRVSDSKGVRKEYAFNL